MITGTYKPKGTFKRDLAQAELTYDEFVRAVRFFQNRHVDFNHVPSRGFRFQMWVADRPQMIIMWCGPGTVRDYLDAPSTLFAEMKSLESKALSA